MTDKVVKGRYAKRLPGRKGSNQPKLTTDDVRIIRFAHAGGGATQKRLAEVFEVTEANIYAFIKRRSWKHLGIINRGEIATK
jgi:hypothetical protein